MGRHVYSYVHIERKFVDDRYLIASAYAPEVGHVETQKFEWSEIDKAIRWCENKLKEVAM